MKTMTADDVIGRLDLKPLPGEGGYYRETYRSGETLSLSALPGRYTSARSFGTAIYYLITPEERSLIHRLKSDEVFHFYLGDPALLLQLPPGESARTVTLGADIRRGQVPQCVVPRGVWQGIALAEGGRFALLGTTVAPAFDSEDFESGNRAALTALYPDVKAMIELLTNP